MQYNDEDYPEHSRITPEFERSGDYAGESAEQQEIKETTMHTMQAAMALSPVNKAMTTLENGDIFLIQEFANEYYRMWIVAPKDIPVWSGYLVESEIDGLPAKYHADPAARVWKPLGIAPDTRPDYQAMETALQALAGQILNLRTELLVIKAMLAKSESGE